MSESMKSENMEILMNNIDTNTNLKKIFFPANSWYASKIKENIHKIVNLKSNISVV